MAMVESLKKIKEIYREENEQNTGTELLLAEEQNITKQRM